MCRTAPRRRVRLYPGRRFQTSQGSPKRRKPQRASIPGACSPSHDPSGRVKAPRRHQPSGVSTGARAWPASCAATVSMPWRSATLRHRPELGRGDESRAHDSLRSPAAHGGRLWRSPVRVASVSKESQYGRSAQSAPGCRPWSRAGAGCRTRVPGMRESEPLQGAAVSAGYDAGVPVRRPPSDRPTQAPRPNSPPKPRAPLGLARLS